MNENQPTQPRMIPTVLVIFGATGDLTKKKIIPALYHLYLQGHLPKLFEIVGFSRQTISDSVYQELAESFLRDAGASINEKTREFLTHIRYQQGTFESSDDYRNLAKVLGRVDNEWRVCANKLFYLAVPPQHYELLFQHLADSGLTLPCGPDEGWTRVIVEKPFGNDLSTAKRLDHLLGKLFKEEQIFRIDHYLAKEMVQNILAFRFSNNLFEHAWNKDLIETIELTFSEELDVKTRGGFYDQVGALRDVGQNHILQMLALLTMDHPETLSAETIRTKRFEALQRLTPLSRTAITTQTRRARYRGYEAVKGVASGSQTETYFQIKTSLSGGRWEGVPVILTGGKALPETKKEIVVTFRHPSPCLCPSDGPHFQNRVVFQIDPHEAISISLWTKKPGFTWEWHERSFNFFLRDGNETERRIDPYEKLLLDCFNGDQLLFVSTAEIETMWRFIDPIIQTWQTGQPILGTYEPGQLPDQIKEVAND